MSGFDWAALLRLGLGVLRLQPRDFWALTPVELMLMAGLAEGEDRLDRARFETLAAEWPDERETDGSD